jgi:hypothetical protein
MRNPTLAIALLLALAACGSDDAPTAERAEATPTSKTTEPTASTTPEIATAEIVGDWQRLTTCEDRVKALQDAGLGKYAVEHAAGEGWIPGVSSPDQIKDPGHPCNGAVPLKHGHFFTEDGLFGSTDEQGDQVDDGSYEAIDENTIVIKKEFGNVTFNYRISNGSLYLDPVMPKCAKSGCFDAQWAIAAAYPGLPWDRVK